MPYLIEEVDSIFEVHVSNPTSKWGILQAIRELAGMDPRERTVRSLVFF
ncbi:MAG: hypothetical protein ABSB94_21085 [Syntrophorhabdales bacterium]